MAMTLPVESVDTNVIVDTCYGNELRGQPPYSYTLTSALKSIPEKSYCLHV